MKKFLALMLFLIFNVPGLAGAAQETVNVYAWSDVIPDSIIRQFEQETGIKVNFSTFSSNEAMYAKLRTVPAPLYDVIEPSSYYIDRMRRQAMLEPLDRKALTHFRHLDPSFLNKDYDPGNRFSVPYIWGATGIFFNSRPDEKPRGPLPKRWKDLWQPEWRDQLMLLNDSREVFAAALITLGYSVNDARPAHIEAAFRKLCALSPNVRLFKSDGVISLLADEDVDAGMAWNGDVFKASSTNPGLTFVYPADGFVIWVDSFAIPKNPPHMKNALRFINFMMRPDVAASAAKIHGYAMASLSARQMLPRSIRSNPVEYPPASVLKRGRYQRDINDQALALYEKYWEKFRMGECPLSER